MRRALVVGVDDYTFAPLAGCVNDATAIAALLERHHDGSPNFDVRLESSATRASLREQIGELFKDEADVALLYFSGHGTERDLGGYLVTQDATSYDEGVSLFDVLTQANASKAREVVILVDCCYSGALGNIPAVNNDAAVIREGVSIMTASRSTQVALESDGMGMFTRLVTSALEGGAADVLGNVTIAGVYAYVDESLGSWDQRPLLKAHLATLIPLRRAQPTIDVAVLRRFPEWFPEADHEFPLDPSFEPDAEPHNEEHEATFGCLQACRANKLVEPIGEDHMYYAAVNSTACRLTALGRHYWRLANEGRI